MAGWAAAAKVGGDIIGGMIGSHSARSINASQIRLAREQMRFQERMSSTAYQRSAKDLEAAGLNRILALGKPSTTPPGAQPPKLSVPGEHMQRGISSAAQTGLMYAQMKKLDSETEAVDANSFFAKQRVRAFKAAEGAIVDAAGNISFNPTGGNKPTFVEALVTGRLNEPYQMAGTTRNTAKSIRIENQGQYTPRKGEKSIQQMVSDTYDDIKKRTGKAPTRKQIERLWAYFKKEGYQ